jgi:hypothetical protein
MHRIVIAAAAYVALGTGAAVAQGQGTPTCKDAAMPFEAAAANRLRGATLREAITGKKLVYIREMIRTPGAWFRGTREHRPDGSMIYRCDVAGSANGPWRPCKSFGSAERRAEGARDVGVWSIKNEALCSAKAAFGDRTEDCFAIHKQGGVLAAKRVSGPRAACVQGTVTLD